MPRSLDDVSWPVRTDRLLIRPATSQDLEATWAFRQLPEVGAWITRAPADLDEYRTQFEDPDSLARTLVIELEGAVIGDLMVRLKDAWAQAEVSDQAEKVQAELGWTIHPDPAGKGYATEAVRALPRSRSSDCAV